MDTIVFVITMIGASSLWHFFLLQRCYRISGGICLYFIDIIQVKTANKNGKGVIDKLIPQHKVVEVKSQSQSLVQLKRISNRSELIKKTSNKTIFSLSIPAYSAITGDSTSTNRGSQYLIGIIWEADQTTVQWLHGIRK